jgi:hypothetical protein
VISDQNDICEFVHAGYNNWSNVASTWGMMVLFTNLHTCAYGCETTALYGIDPPTVEEYLYSTNNGLMA